MNLVNIHNDQITAVISTKGAEIQSIRDGNDMEFMWQGDPAFFSGRAPILFPVAGGFRGDCYELNGKRYGMPKHGFVRKLDWQVEKTTESQVTMLMQEKAEGFPFEYDLRATFAVHGNALSVSYAVTSRDDLLFYFSIGAHEAYATPEGIEEYEVVFDKLERLDVYPLQGNLTPRTPWLLKDHAKTLPLRTEYFTTDALVFRSLCSRGVTLRNRLQTRSVRIDFPEHPVLMVWTKPNAHFICIEPWCNGPDFVDADFAIETKPGFMRLNQNETVVRTHTIQIG